MPHLNSGYDTDSSDDSVIHNDIHPTSLVPFQKHEVTNNIPGGMSNNMVTTVETPYNNVLASDPFDDILEVSISTRGTQLTLGLELDNNVDLGSCLQLINYFQSTPSAHMPR